MLTPNRLVSGARVGLDLLREQGGGPRRLLTVAAHRAVPASFRALPLTAAVRLAYNVVFRREPTAEEAEAALDKLRSGEFDHDAFLDSLQSSFPDLPFPVVVRLGYAMLLRREPDPDGEAIALGAFERGDMDRLTFLDWLRGSGEFVAHGFDAMGPSLHSSRCQFVRTLPRADRILDLGGTDLGHVEGAFVHMGYPYDFSELVLVDLLPDDRHPLYQREGLHDTVTSWRGPIRYQYHSMTDLSRYDDDSFDLVYSGQTFEHVTEADGDLVLKEVRRVLKPGGAFALDTPNARICRMQQDEFIDPDHKVEYTAAELEAKLDAAGFAVHEKWGLNFAGSPLAEGRFSAKSTAHHSGIFAEAEDCYLLAYVCRHADQR